MEVGIVVAPLLELSSSFFMDLSQGIHEKNNLKGLGEKAAMMLFSITVAPFFQYVRDLAWTPCNNKSANPTLPAPVSEEPGMHITSIFWKGKKPYNFYF